MTTQRIFLAGLVCAASVACAPEIHAIQDYQAPFLCDGNQTVQMRFAPFKAVLESQGLSVALTQRAAADGFLYMGEGQSWRQRGYDATWTDGKGAVHHCRDANAATPKKDAMGRGN
jgi:hypothetical protein